MSDLIPLKTGKGHYMASYHANARGKDEHGEFHTIEQYVTFTEDGGLTWTSPRVIFPGTRDMHLCEGGFVRSPDGKTIALLLRENSRHHNSQIMFPEMKAKHGLPPKNCRQPCAETATRFFPCLTEDCWFNSGMFPRPGRKGRPPARRKGTGWDG